MSEELAIQIFGCAVLGAGFVYACWLNFHRYRQQKAITECVKRVPRYRSDHARQHAGEAQ